MALNAAVVWEVRSTGNDLNGGGYKTGASGTDCSQQDAAQKSGADLTMHATTNTKVSPVAAKVAAADVGNLVYIASGTDWTPGYYEITAQDGGDPGYWTLDRSPSAAANANLATYKMGGAVATPGMIGATLVVGNVVYCKGNQTITSATTNIAGGCPAPTVGSTWVGYATNRNSSNTDTKPVFTLAGGVSTSVMLGTNVYAVNVSLDGAGNTSSRGSSGRLVRCHGANFTNYVGSGTSVYCTATGCSAVSAFTTYAAFCHAYGNTFTGFNNCYAICCLSTNNTGASGVGFGSGVLVGCASYGNASHGYVPVSTAVYINCIAEGNGGWGYYTYTAYPIVMINCAGYNNTSGNVGTMHAQVMNLNFITVTVGSVFVDAAGGNFALNNTANRGALLRGTGFPATFPLGLTASYSDIGAAQHADPAAGGGGFPILGGSVVR